MRHEDRLAASLLFHKPVHARVNKHHVQRAQRPLTTERKVLHVRLRYNKYHISILRIVRESTTALKQLLQNGDDDTTTTFADR